ncbi:MAG: DUF4293 family protein [Bacteroidales bacterium]|nr:DUF4293 domain-containing protein [Bacteroidales bacterium]MDD2424660.1 DUF4293 family protein [Bacteroidales bacterium]MDD3989120.1 DUF4293 family protein [Bacteroidales bacterium]MDD4638941.1 DUF4293 family protein [Bacteroidales bacterium]
MIQRIQTLFLLGVFLLSGSHFFSTMAYNLSEKVKYIGFTPFIILIIITTLISLLTIFLYRHRMLQIRLSVFNAVVIASYQTWILYLFFTRPQESVFSVTALFPLVSLLFTIVAIKYIARDEAMIRSVNSLRKSRKK